MGPQEDYIETVFTCEGDFDDPHLHDKLEDFKKSLKDLLLTDKSKLILKKVEPWNSVRVTFNIPREAAIRLKQLAQQGNATLRDLGVLAVQIQDQNISLTIAGRNNERTQLVFRTADTISSTVPSVSVFDTNSPTLDELGPQGPGPSHVDATNKNIAEYLRQGSSLIESLFNPSTDGAKAAKINNVLPTSSEHGGSQQRTFPPQQPPSQPSHHVNTSSLSTMVSSVNNSRGLIGQEGLRFPQLPGLPPGLPPGMQPNPRHALDNLPPPPPYPQGSSYVNNLQKLRFGSGTSPLLVNLLQNDPNLSSLLQAGRLPPSLETEAVQPPKKKRSRPRKKKKPTDGELPVSSVSNPVVSGPPADVPSAAPPVSTSTAHTNTSFVNREVTTSVKEHSFQNPQAVHNISVQTKLEQIVPLTKAGLHRSEADTAGKIINPVTGLLEPVENLSDTSPAKSDGKNSPRSLGQKLNIAGDALSNPKLKTVGGVTIPQGKHPNLHPGLHRQTSEHSNPLGIQKAYNSSQLNYTTPSDRSQKHYNQEVVGSKLSLKPPTSVRNDIIPSLDETDPRLITVGRSEHKSVDSKCLKLSGSEKSVPKLESVKQEGLPQESVKKIPPQLLNKPLLQVKHNIVGGKPSDSPDSNGDSECSTQSINLDTQNGADSGGQAGPHSDSRSYNNDSGVGSCSERSDDTPSEPGDSDYKGVSSSSFECAKNPILDPLKQGPPPPSNSKVMTVGYAVADTQQKDLKNHKVLSSPYLGSDKLLNCKYELAKLKVEKSDSCATSQSQVLSWAAEEHSRMANNVDGKHVGHETVNRKSPKLVTSMSNILSHGNNGQLNPMQGNVEPSMHKKKSSPRNSPRGSPRTPGSPRTSDPSIAASLPRQSFLASQEYSAHIPSPRESQTKSPFSDPGAGKSPHNDQRRSPFNFSHSAPAPSVKSSTVSGHSNNSENLRDFYGVGVDSMRMSPQFNMDNIAIFKSLEAQANPHIGQLSALAGSKDAAIRQKLEELMPFFKKLQQHAAQVSSGSPVVSNGTETFNHSSRSPLPLGPSPKPSGSHPNLAELHNAFEVASLQNNLHPALSVSNTSSLSDRDASSVNCVVTKSSKVNSEEPKGANSGATSRRSSPGAATSNPYPQYDSSLPQPKRLTESVQKLFPLPLLDNSLPHANRKSPSSCTSSTRSSVTSTVSPPAGSRVASSSSSSSLGTKTPVGDLDIDAITPSITGFGFGPIDILVDTSKKSQSDKSAAESVSMPILSLTDSHLPQLSHSVVCTASVTDSHLPQLSHHSVVCTASVKVVPAVSGSIPSHRTFVGDSSSLGDTCSVSSGMKVGRTGSVSAGIPSDLKPSQCNSDNKMASSSSAKESWTLKTQISSSVVGPPVLHPQNVKYPLNKTVEKPKSPYQQMGLSEMLQETANLQSISAGRLSPHVQSVSPRSSLIHTYLNSTDSEPLLDTTNTRAVKSIASVNVSNETELVNCDPPTSSKVETVSGSTVVKTSTDNLDIPKLKCQALFDACITQSMNSISSSSSVLSSSGVNVVCSASSTPPPLLTAVSQISEPAGIVSSVPTSLRSVNESVSASRTAGSSSEQSVISVSSANSSASSKLPTISVKTSVSKVLEESDAPPAACSVSLETPMMNSPASQSNEEVNCLSTLSDTSNSSASGRAGKIAKTRRASSESVEDKLEECDLVPRQLRSRKRTNTADGDGAAGPDDVKRLKLDTHSDNVSTKSDKAKDSKTSIETKAAGLSNAGSAHEGKQDESTSNSIGDGLKTGLRTRISVKNSSNDDKDVKGRPSSGREAKKDGKVVSGKALSDKKAELMKAEELKKNQQSRRNRQSPSAPALDKPATQPVCREKSPLRAGRTRGHSSPVVMENSEEVENKRTTRSAKSKVEPVAQVPPSKAAAVNPASKAAPLNKRRRTSQDPR